MPLVIDTILESSFEQRRRRLALPAPQADAIELRLDASDSPQSELTELSELLSTSRKPVILTCRSRLSGGRFTGAPSEKMRVLEQGSRLGNSTQGVQYVDCEEHDPAPALARHVRLIRSLHDFDGVPADLDQRARAMIERGADIIKVACQASTLAEVIHLLELTKRLGHPCVAIAMGELGAFGRIIAGALGMPLTYGTGGSEAAAPGQLSVHELVELYHANELGPSDPVFALIGHPVAHSLSPHIHNRALKVLGARGTYVTIDCANLTDLPLLEQLPIAGFSVTLPHKTAVLARAAELEPRVAALGAANTLYRRQDRLVAANTDYDGFLSALREVEPRLEGVATLVIGAGGAARAVVKALRDAGAEVTITNRSERRAEQLAQELGAKTIPLMQIRSLNAGVVVQATSCGMTPNDDRSPVPADLLRPGQVAFDLVYNPARTRFLREAEARGARTISGLRMLAGQAQGQLERFSNRTLPSDVLLDLTLAAAAERGIS